MRTSALIYRKASNRSLFAAFFCATCIFAAALCFGHTTGNVPTISGPLDSDSPPDAPETIVDADLEPEPVAPPPAATDDVFPEETTAVPVRTLVKRQSKPIARPAVASHPGEGIPGHGENLAVYAPRPDYPFEARRQGAIGTGVVSLTIDPGTGLVTGARMIRTTGKSILDSSALRTFSRWRFRTGAPHVVEIPITFMLTGVSY